MKKIVVLITLFLSAHLQADDHVEAVSLFGKPLVPAPASEMMLEKYEIAKADYKASPNDAMALIWYGRRTAYLGRYRDAIAIFSEGIEKHPTDARMYRHRGHRYISVRQFDKAIADLENAAALIKGTDNAIEPDGLPNKYNIPLSTTHGNIWYHLGLAYYLKQDFENAYRAYKVGHTINANADNRVSTTHWLYMILRRMGRDVEAKAVLDDVWADMKILENDDYHLLTLFYKGEKTIADLGVMEATTPGNSAVAYGLANWYFYNGETDKAHALLEKIISGSAWSAFGYIAAEADLKALQK